jgi:hypothetical protein
MNPISKVGAALAAVLVIAVVVIAVIGWNLLPASSGLGGPLVTPAPSPSTMPSPTPSTLAAPWWLAGTVGPCGEAPVTYGCAGELVAGLHTSGGLAPAVTYRVPDGWVNVRDWRGYFTLFPDTPANRAGVAAGGDPTTEILIVPIDVSTFACDNLSPESGAWTATEITTRLAARDGLDVVPVAATIGGLPGSHVDTAAEPDWNTECPVAIPSSPSGADGRYRVLVLDRPDGNVIAVHLRSAEAAEFEPFVTSAMPIVESLDFDLSQPPSPSPS